MAKIKCSFRMCECGCEYFEKKREWHKSAEGYLISPFRKRDRFECLECGQKSYSQWIELDGTTGVIGFVSEMRNDKIIEAIVW